MPFNTLGITLGYGLCCFISLIGLYLLVETRLTSFFNEASWKVWKEITWSFITISLIGICNFLYSTQIGLAKFSIINLIYLEAYTFAVGFFPIVIYILIKQNRLSKRYFTGSEHINLAIATNNINEDQKDFIKTICIQSDNINEEIRLSIDDLIAIQSTDNYITVNYQLNNQLNRKVLRNSLKQVEIEFKEYQNLFRCHKSYLVNLDYVTKVSGNAQGYKLSLNYLDELIPVSRAHNDIIKTKLAEHHN